MTTSINGERLWNSLMAMAAIGPGPNGGSCRLALTPEDSDGRLLLLDWCEALGLTTQVDGVGNLFIRREGRQPDLPPIATGSHLDTQPNGGRFDGVLGVLAGLEVFRTLSEHDITTTHPLMLVVWTNEEGSRFAPAMVASGTWAGAFDTEYTLTRTDRDGITFGQALEAIGFTGDTPVGEPHLSHFIELHIEQGPVLEAAGESIGIVTGVQGMRWFDVVFTGQSAHAGTTPMAARADALAAAARLIDRLHHYAVADETGTTRITFGTLDVPDSSRNVVPGQVRLSVDLRQTDDDALDALQQRFRTELEACGEAFGVQTHVERIWASPVTHFDPTCIAAIEQAARARHYRCRKMVSGAGHDAVYVSRRTPTAMIFVPCWKGLSHNEAEYASPEHCAQGAQVLCDALLSLDRCRD
ncbi:M20 family metallo-hydrolase [Larsenimonas rhizosphaerae]|uniref:M20 family metallo-hydrolase n=1 Tax=Larsenimonas rhizosphaerae TaxID=2944682 RepID=A0AA42CVG6_9GAMM|nr:M20 family metallo-hydrolase [Larsenimonas rhizosphaerae]MCM2131262.1 M20 family metallo-hydrolase [Larsenimonas rhizosphaerae]MCX2525379.1 M20 family metallo-hydrolase [Larsenimonas rhizosphaerae]